MKPVLSIGVLALVLAGCATPVKVAWVGLPAVQATPVSSYILRNENALNPEAAELVRAALASRGFREASSGEAAELILSVDAGIGAPRATLVSNWGMPSNSLVADVPRNQTTWTASPNLSGAGGGYATAVSYPGAPSSHRYLVGTSTSYLAHSAPAPQNGMWSGTDAVFVREQYLRISALDGWGTKKKRPDSEVWSVRVSVQAQSDDLRQNLALLASTATDAIAKNTRNTDAIAKNTRSEVKRAP